jgi:hypothetical protein
MIALQTVFNDVIVQQVIVVSFIAGIEGITSYITLTLKAPRHFGRIGTSGELAKGERLVA